MDSQVVSTIQGVTPGVQLNLSIGTDVVSIRVHSVSITASLSKMAGWLSKAAKGAMQVLIGYASHGYHRLVKAERRVKVLLLLTAVFLVWNTVTAFRSGTVLGFVTVWDRCASLIDNSKSPWQPGPEEWWQKLCKLEHDMRQISYVCRDRRWMGNRVVCFDNNLVPPNNCTVYSFGIAYDFKFDDAMAGYGCTVYSFDPSMKEPDHRHADRVYFKRLGLAANDTDSFVPRQDSYVKGYTTWRMRRLTSIMKELGHSKGSLTIVKIDIESYEWDVMKNLLSVDSLLTSIPQVLIEWHLFSDTPPRSRYDELISIYFGFKARGFRSFFWGEEGKNHQIDRMRTQTETSWVNQRFLASSAV